MVGEIHLAHIYFTDGSNAEVRPILLLKPNSFKDVLYMPLTSNTNVKGITISNNNLQDGYLPKISIIVYEKPRVISTTLLLKKIGTLKKDVFKQTINTFIQFIKERTIN